MNPQQPLIRPRRLEGKLVDPFAEFQSDNIVHARGPQIATEVVALSIPGLCEPGVDPTFEPGSTDAERSIRGQFLIDCVIDLKNARAIDSVPLRTLVPFMWQGFGYRYAIRGAVVYVLCFLLPLSVLCSLLAGMQTSEDVDASATPTAAAAAGLTALWALRHAKHEGRQYLAAHSIAGYLGDVWNVIDVLLLLLYTATGATFLLRELWWCKQAAAVAILLAHLKAAQFFQAFPGLGRLVQLVFTVVPAMKNFMALLGLATAGLGMAFMLVFSAGPFARDANWLGYEYATKQQLEHEGGQDMEFGTVPVAMFRAFTTINGDFDVSTLWLRGSPAVAVFSVALLFGNVVLLNLLIAIVSDEFDQFMERAGLEAQLALAGMCKEAREVTAVRILR